MITLWYRPPEMLLHGVSDCRTARLCRQQHVYFALQIHNLRRHLVYWLHSGAVSGAKVSAAIRRGYASGHGVMRRRALCTPFQLFHFFHAQIFQIFGFLGSPTECVWPGFKQLPDYTPMLPKFTVNKHAAFHSVGITDTHAVDLILVRVLPISGNPARRSSILSVHEMRVAADA